jgi:hypothetical protein
VKRRGDGENRSRMSESELLRQEAEQLKSVIRVGSGSRPLPSVKIIDISSKKGRLSHRVHRVATTAFCRTFHHEGKISPGW